MLRAKLIPLTILLLQAGGGATALTLPVRIHPKEPPRAERPEGTVTRERATEAAEPVDGAASEGPTSARQAPFPSDAFGAEAEIEISDLAVVRILAVVCLLLLAAGGTVDAIRGEAERIRQRRPPENWPPCSLHLYRRG